MKMSWDKNTIRNSEIDKTIEILKEFNEQYKLKILGKVRGYGLNDDYVEDDMYKIRKLIYKDFIILEKMIRSSDCDFDDVIHSFKFKKNKVPKKWKIEVVQ